VRALIVWLVVLARTSTASADEPGEPPHFAAFVAPGLVDHEITTPREPTDDVRMQGPELTLGFGYAFGRLEASLQARGSFTGNLDLLAIGGVGPALKVWIVDRLWFEGNAQLGADQRCGETCLTRTGKSIGARLGFTPSGPRHSIVVGSQFSESEGTFTRYALSVAYQYEGYWLPYWYR